MQNNAGYYNEVGLWDRMYTPIVGGVYMYSGARADWIQILTLSLTDYVSLTILNTSNLGFFRSVIYGIIEE